MRPALAGSVEALLHDAAVGNVARNAVGNFMLALAAPGAARDALLEERLERAIGVLYLPRTERRSHYFSARLAEQFDAVIHFDASDAVQPLEPSSLWDTGEAPETYPIGL